MEKEFYIVNFFYRKNFFTEKNINENVKYICYLKNIFFWQKTKYILFYKQNVNLS